MDSKFFNSSALQGLNRIGDLLIPQNADFPAFSESGAAQNVDDLLEYALAEDVSLLNTVLGVMHLLPESTLNWLVRRMETSNRDQGALSSLLRQLNFGLRGIIFSLYYGGKAGFGESGKTPLEVIGYDLKRVDT